MSVVTLRPSYPAPITAHSLLSLSFPALFWHAFAVAAFLMAALASAASLSAEAPGAAIAVVPSPTAAEPAASSALMPAGAAPGTGCDAQSMLPDPGPVGAADAACVAPDLERDQAYLVETARPGATMLRQGLALAIVRLHPMFVRRLAEAIGEVRAAGLRSAGIFSAYRPPAFGVGGFADKFSSLHTYGLAVDMLGVGGPGSSEARLWYEIVARHGIVCPYGAGNRREWNHCQPTRVKSIMAGDPLRGTVSPRGPIDRQAMFAMGDALVNEADAGAGSSELQPSSDEKWLSRIEPRPRPRAAARPRESVETGHDQTNAGHERHGRVKSVAGLAANPGLHESHGQTKRRTMAENASIKSGPVAKYRTASLIRREPVAANVKRASSHEKAPPKRIEANNARLDRVIKGICRGC